MSFPGAEFKKRMAVRDYKGAHKALDQAAAKYAADDASHARWRAHVLQFEGNTSHAVDVLSPFVEVDDLSGKFLRHQRALIYAHAGMQDEALKDFRALVEDATPRIAEALHAGCWFEIAYILAMQGSPEFQAAYDMVPEARQQFVGGAILAKPDLAALHKGKQV